MTVRPRATLSALAGLVALAACKKAPPPDVYAPPAGLSLATAQGEPPQGGQRLTLTSERLARDGATLATGAELRDARRDATTRQRVVAAIGTPSDVLVYVDRATPFEIASAALGALGHAGVRIDHVSVAVVAADGRTAAIRLGPPRPRACEPTLRTAVPIDAGPPSANALPCTDDAGLDAVVHVETGGYGVAVTGANLGTGCADLGRGPAVVGRDLPALAACLSRLKHLHKEFEEERSVVVDAAPSTPFADVAPVLAAVRSDASGAPLLPDVTLSLPR